MNNSIEPLLNIPWLSLEGEPFNDTVVLRSVNAWDALKSESGAIEAVAISTLDDLHIIESDISTLSLIVIHVDDFTDGRFFTIARELRERYQFKGELRATGNFMDDQIAHMSRLGFSSFGFESAERARIAKTVFEQQVLRQNYQAYINPGE